MVPIRRAAPSVRGARVARRRGPAWAVGLAALGVAALAGCSDDPPMDLPRPNVLLIVMDTCRGDRVSVNGYGAATTPFLEEFAADAVRYADAWSPAPWTGPSHASLFTGLRPENHGFVEGVRAFLREEERTLAETLKAAGYRTACFTNNEVISAPMGLVQGFDRIEPLYADAGVGYPSAPETHERASAWVKEGAAGDAPFFLFINHMEPHLPYTPPAAMRERFLGSDVPADGLAESSRFGPPASVATGVGAVRVPDGLRRVLSPLYDAEIATLDDALRGLFAGLREAGVLDDTLVIITADHGENLGEHGIYDHRFSLHRTLLHVPMLVRRPGQFDGGRVVRDVVRLEDLFPTVLDVCHVKRPDDLDGRSLFRDVPGRVAFGVHGSMVRYEDMLRSAFPQADLRPLQLAWRSVYDGRHHLIRRSDGQEWLYDVQADPLEQRNLLGEEPNIAARLRELDTQR